MSEWYKQLGEGEKNDIPWPIDSFPEKGVILQQKKKNVRQRLYYLGYIYAQLFLRRWELGKQTWSNQF